MRRELLALAFSATIALLAAASLVASAQAESEIAKAAVRQWKAMSAAIAMGVSALGSGYALAKAGAAASAAAAERPEVAGRLLIYLVLGEGIAIYGLLVAILIIFTG
jgi:V/A-type H+-transporting ATPase subunit K